MARVLAASLEVRRPGLLRYARALELQRQIRDARLAGDVPDTLLLLEHPDVITFGRGAQPSSARMTDDELRAAGYDVHRTNRGGDVTWHGPGQLVGYPILDLARHGSDVHVYLRRIEDVLVETLAEFGIASRARAGFAGVWIDDTHKIASIGVGVRRWVTMHGFALNVSCDLARFDAIVPCGLADVEMTSMERLLGRRISVYGVGERVEAQFRKAFA